MAPAGTPQAIIDRINTEVRTTLNDPDVKKRYVDIGSETAGMSQADFLTRIRQDAVRYKAVVKAANVKAD